VKKQTKCGDDGIESVLGKSSYRK